MVGLSKTAVWLLKVTSSNCFRQTSSQQPDSNILLFCQINKRGEVPTEKSPLFPKKFLLIGFGEFPVFPFKIL